MDKLFNLKAFHESTTKELDITKDRVRNLIGSSNWGEDGRYKEYILRNIIRKFVPSNLKIGTGFIVKNENDEYKCSSQIDILIFDSSYPVLFNEGDFFIVSPNSVKAIIEVKTNIENQSLHEAVEKINKNIAFINNHSVFSGIFSFEGYQGNNITESNLRQKLMSINQSNKRVNHICLNKDIFIKFWPILSKYSVYRINNLSFSYFISNLVYSVTNQNIQNESDLWFPINKESEKLFDINLGGNNDR